MKVMSKINAEFIYEGNLVFISDVSKGFEFTVSWQPKGEEIDSNET